MRRSSGERCSGLKAAARDTFRNISGTSAGAMNAAVLADGWTEGGAEGARAALDRAQERPALESILKTFRPCTIGQ
jgi:predicted acylesterase/phospholipase RssA